MKIRQKLVMGFLGTASLVGIASLICLNSSQKALQESIGDSSVSLAVETIDKIDREIYHALEELQIYSTDLTLQQVASESNRQFSILQNIEEYIDKNNAEWLSTPAGIITPLVDVLLNNPLSKELKEKIDFHSTKHSNDYFIEAFITNRYGANIASTQRTSDYRQNDEEWWQKAYAEGLYVGEAEFDESSGVYSIPIAIKICDKETNFIGVIKVILNINETIEIITNMKENSKYRSARFTLLNKDGKAIFVEDEFSFLEDLSNSTFFRQMTGLKGYFLRKSGERHGQSQLMAYARSSGYNDYQGLGWILAIEYDSAELFAPVIRLRNIILGTSLILGAIGVIPGLLISQHISRPLSKLIVAINKIAKGEHNITIEAKGNDEIGQLADAFNQMVIHRKKTEDALGISQGKLNAMLRAIADDIALIDKNLNILWTNDVAKEIFGEDIIGKKCYEAYHQRNRPCEPYPCPTLKAFQDGKIHQYESQATDKYGKIRYFHTIANVAMRDVDEKPCAVLEICRDITERKYTEEALRLSEQKYSALVQQSPDAIISLDKTGNFLSFNPAAERQSGFSSNEVLGRHFAKIDILAKESRSKAIEEFGLILMGTDRPPFMLTIMRKDQTYLHMEANARLIKEKEHNAWIQVTLRDITERKQAEDRLEKINTCLLSLGSDFVENANRITALLGELLGANCTFYNCLEDEMLYLTAYWHASANYTPLDKTEGHFCHDVIQKGDNDVCVIRDLQNSPYQSDLYVSTYGLKTYIGQLVKSNGNNHGILSALFTNDFDPSADEKKIIGILASALRGEEERRMAEQELDKLNKDLESANHELTRANKELQEFAYITAHDLKTPLRAIGTLVDWISTDYADTFDEEGRKQARLLVEKAEQMSALIDDILQYSRLGQEGQLKRQVDLNQLVSEMITGIAPPDNIQITIKNNLPVLMCDKTQITQIFQNLVSNAIKYIDKPEGHIEIYCVDQEGFWKFGVSDNGPGIEDKYFDKIFQIFQTLAPRNGTENTGIGLSIVKKLVELNKGKVWIESTVSQGTTFFFTLPKSLVLGKYISKTALASELG